MYRKSIIVFWRLLDKISSSKHSAMMAISGQKKAACRQAHAVCDYM